MGVGGDGCEWGWVWVGIDVNADGCRWGWM